MRISSLMAVAALAGALTVSGNIAVAEAKSACAEIGGNFQSGNVCHVNETTPAYVIDLRFPTDYADQHAVTDYLTQERNNLVGLARAPGAQRLPYNLYVTWELFSAGQSLSTAQQQRGYGQPPHGTQSLALSVFADAEGAGQPGKNRLKTFTYDLNRNRPVTFGDLFVPDATTMDKIYSAVSTDLARQQKSRDFHLAANIGRDPERYQNFAITDDAVIFFFDAGEFFPAEAGDARTTVPRALLPPLQI